MLAKLLSLMLIVCLTGPTHANSIRVEFEGVITTESVLGDIGEFGLTGSLLGETISGQISYYPELLPPNEGGLVPRSPIVHNTIFDTDWMSHPVVTISNQPGFSPGPICEPPYVCSTDGQVNEGGLYLINDENSYSLSLARDQGSASIIDPNDRFKLHFNRFGIYIPLSDGEAFSSSTPFTADPVPVDGQAGYPFNFLTFTTAEEIRVGEVLTRTEHEIEIGFELIAVSATAVPLPASAFLMLSAIGGLAARVRMASRRG